MRKLLFASIIFASACSDSPTKPTREAPVTDTSSGEHRAHWNVAVLMPDNKTIGFVCAESNHERELADGTRVKVSHMLSSEPCDAFGRGKQNFAPESIER